MPQAANSQEVSQEVTQFVAIKDKEQFKTKTFGMAHAILAICMTCCIIGVHSAGSGVPESTFIKGLNLLEKGSVS